MTNGQISPYYPSSLDALSEMSRESSSCFQKREGSTADTFLTSAETAKALMKDYEITDISETKDVNINRFMQFCGVPYQMVS